MIDKGLISLHRYLATPQKDYLILFDKNSVGQTQAINSIKTYTKKFLVLDDVVYKPTDFKNVIVASAKTLGEFEKILDNVFTDGDVDNRKTELIDLIESACAIYFSISQTFDNELKVYEHFLLFRKLSPLFYVKDIIFNDETTIVIIYTNNKKRIEFCEHPEEKPICLFLGYGIGDFFITSAFFYHLIEKYKRITIILLAQRPVKKLLKDLYSDRCDIYEVNDRMVLERIYKLFVDSGKFAKCYNALYTDYKHADHFQHYFNMFADQLYDIEVKEPYLYMDAIYDTFCSIIEDHEKEIINQITENKKTRIGLQIWTDEPGKGRCWDQKNVQELINQYSNEYTFYILTPYPKDLYDIYDAINLENLSIEGMTCAIKHMDAIVGIDSCCGHIAAAFNVPSITLWNSQTPVLLEYDFVKLSFRPMRKNYSIVPKSKNINDIKGELVGSILRDCLANKIVLTEDILSLKSIFNNENTLFV